MSGWECKGDCNSWSDHMKPCSALCKQGKKPPLYAVSRPAPLSDHSEPAAPLQIDFALLQMTDSELVLHLRGTGLLSSSACEELQRRGLFTGTALCLTSGETVPVNRTLPCCCHVNWRGPTTIPPHQAPPHALHRTAEEHARLRLGGTWMTEDERFLWELSRVDRTLRPFDWFC